MATAATDFLVIGGGVIGLSLALEARRRHPGARVTVLEKEEACGLHASGRNSGVLHAGFYYTADSLKARFTRDGQRAMSAYCEERGLGINRCGKLVVARTGEDLAGLDELLRRARANGVEVYEVGEARGPPAGAAGAHRGAGAVEPQHRVGGPGRGDGLAGARRGGGGGGGEGGDAATWGAPRTG